MESTTWRGASDLPCRLHVFKKLEKWSGVMWSEMRWGDLKRDNKTSKSEVKWSEVKWNEVKWSEVKIFGGMCVVCGLFYSTSHCRIAICFISSALCYVLINCFMFLNFSFHICFLVFYVFLSVLSVLCFRIILCIVSTYVCSRLFSICVQGYRPLQPVGKPISVDTYHIMGARGNAVGWGTALQVGISRFGFPMVSVEFFIDIILPAALWPWFWLSL
jgi:hypothetical protein